MTERAEIERRLQVARDELGPAERASDRLSWARGIYFVAAVAGLTALSATTWTWYAAAIVPFVALVWLHRRATERAERIAGAVAAGRAALARMDRDWANMPPVQQVRFAEFPNRAVVRDLDLFGDRSLFRLLDVGIGSIGGTTLMRWLLSDPPPLEVIEQRQASVEALRARPGFLLEAARLSRHGPRPGPNDSELQRFREWCQRPGQRFSPALAAVARVCTTALLLAAIGMGLLPQARPELASGIVTLIGIQFALATTARRHLRSQLGDTAELLPALRTVVAVIRAQLAEVPVAGRFGEVQRALSAAGTSDGLDRLSRLFEWDAVRHSPMLHAAVNAVVGFDAHLASRMDRWRGRFGPQVAEWIDLHGEAQALTALATIAFENPTWTFPRIHDARSPILTATSCGHPLIGPEVRVSNPVAIDAPGSVIVISGSNMSGKTTYLRAVGLNALLAMAGGPVCGTDLTIRRCRVRTSVRVEDDLAAGVSLFFAEVSRIRAVVADATEPNREPVLFLFDEILHGTNAPDRRRASQLVLQRLVAAGSAGLITTHDPGVGEIEDAASSAPITQAHFTDSIVTRDGQLTMIFDYRIRKGPATTTNALRILETLGLGA